MFYYRVPFVRLQGIRNFLLNHWKKGCGKRPQAYERQTFRWRRGNCSQNDTGRMGAEHGAGHPIGFAAGEALRGELPGSTNFAHQNLRVVLSVLFEVPNLDHAVGAARGDPFSIRTERDAADRLLVPA